MTTNTTALITGTSSGERGVITVEIKAAAGMTRTGTGAVLLGERVGGGLGKMMMTVDAVTPPVQDMAAVGTIVRLPIKELEKQSGKRFSF